MSNKTTLKKQLKAKGIPIPKDATVSELKHRLEYWLGGKGYMFRLAIPTARMPDESHPVKLLDFGNLYWIPNSKYAEMIALTKMVFIIGRSVDPPKGSIVLDVPKDFNDKWGVGATDGDNQ